MSIDERRIILNRVDWLTYYGAREEDGNPAMGSDEASTARNFEAIEDKHRGHIPRKTMSLKRLGTKHLSASFQVGVTVVSVAPHPEIGELVVVGWQSSCWVHAKRKETAGQTYLYECKPEDAVLLPVEERTFQLPPGKEGMGQSKYIFGLNADGSRRPWLRDVLGFVANYEGENLLTQG